MLWRNNGVKEIIMQITFGLTAESLVEQLAGKIDRKDLSMLQQDHDAIVRCWIRNYLTDCEYAAALKRLQKRIVEIIKK